MDSAYCVVFCCCFFFGGGGGGEKAIGCVGVWRGGCVGVRRKLLVVWGSGKSHWLCGGPNPSFLRRFCLFPKHFAPSKWLFHKLHECKLYTAQTGIHLTTASITVLCPAAVHSEHQPGARDQLVIYSWKWVRGVISLYSQPIVLCRLVVRVHTAQKTILCGPM